jgi:hypothetical protein
MILLIAMLFQWKPVRFCSVGLGNMIQIAYIMALMFKGKKIILHPMSPEQIVIADIARAK